MSSGRQVTGFNKMYSFFGKTEHMKRYLWLWTETLLLRKMCCKHAMWNKSAQLLDDQDLWPLSQWAPGQSWPCSTSRSQTSWSSSGSRRGSRWCPWGRRIWKWLEEPRWWYHQTSAEPWSYPPPGNHLQHCIWHVCARAFVSIKHSCPMVEEVWGDMIHNVGFELDTKVGGRQRRQTMRGKARRKWKRGTQESGEDKKGRLWR